MKTKIIALFLAVATFVLGLCFLNEGLFHHDAVVLAQAIEKTYVTHVLQPAIHGRYGSVLVNLLVYFPFYLAGQNADFALRFSSILFQALSIAVLFLLINELLRDEFTALFTAIFFALTPFYFIPNTYGKEHGLSMFVFLLALYTLRKGLAKKSLILISISSFLSVFTITIRESMSITIPLYLFLYFQPEISPVSLRVSVPRERLSAGWLCAVFVPFVLMTAVILQLYLGRVVANSFFVKSSSYCKFAGLFSGILGTALKDLNYPTPLSLFFVLSIFGMLWLIHERGFFLYLFFIFWGSLIFYFGNSDCYCPRYLDIPIIPVYVFSSYMLSVLYRRSKVITLFVMIFACTYMFAFMQPLLTYRQRYNGEKRFALFVQKKTDPNAVVIAADDAPFIEYYGKRSILRIPPSKQKLINQMMDKIRAYLENRVSVYLIESALCYDSKKLFQNTLDSYFTRTNVGSALTEDYHRPELHLQTYTQQLFKIDLKS